MSDTDTVSSLAGKTPRDDEEVRPDAPAPVPLLPHLEALMELQAALAQGEREDEIIQVGTSAAVEIMDADCGVALVDMPGRDLPARFGWGEGRRLAQHEVGIIARALDPFVKEIVASNAARISLSAEHGGHDAAAPPAALQSRGIGSALILALGRGASRRGVLVLGRRDPGPFRREQMLLAEILAVQFAVQIERVRRTTEARSAGERTQREVETATHGLRLRNRELEALNAVAAAASPSFEIERQIDIALHKAAEVTDHAAGAIYLVETDPQGGESLRPARAFGAPPYIARAEALICRRGEGLPGRVWESGRSVALVDLDADPDLQGREALAEAGLRALACVPLHARGRSIGILELATPESRFYSDEAISLLEAVGRQVALTIQNSRLFSDIMRYSLDLETRTGGMRRQVERRERQVRTLAGLLAAPPAAGPDPREMLADALRQVMEMQEADGGAIHLLDWEGGGPRLAVQRGLEASSAGRLGAVDGSLTAVGTVISDPECGPRSIALDEAGQDDPAGLTALGFRSLTIVPLRSNGRTVGVLSLAAREPAPPAGDDLGCLQAVGELLGARIEAPRPAVPSTAPAVAAPPADPEMTASAGPPRGALAPALVQMQKMESVGTLVGGIAHDFNNIVGAILGYASHIRGLVSQDNPIHRQASIIEQQAMRAAELTQQLLAFSGGGQAARELIDLNQVVNETLSFLSKSLDRNIRLEVHTEPELPVVLADRGQIRQILLNVAVNAKEAMPEGGRITFETRLASLDEAFARSVPGLQPGDYVEIVVGDTGVGIPPEVVDRVFEPFFTTKPDGVGTGLGLSAVSGVVQSHAGHVTLQSTPGVGTTVRIYLPSSGRPAPKPAVASMPRSAAPGSVEAGQAPAVHEEDGRAAAPTGAPDGERSPRESAGFDRPPAPTNDRRRPDAAHSIPLAGGAPEAGAVAAAEDRVRVLVIEDEEAIRAMMRDILEAKGYEVILAHDGIKGLEIYRRNWGRIHLVLLDMVMPRMGGLETYRRLMGMDRRLRVILCSGNNQNEQAQVAIREGAFGLLAKPFTITELLAWVERAAGRGGGCYTRPHAG